MANEEHLKILKQGVEGWNKWRDQHSDIRPDLVGVDLAGADLHGADLHEVDLVGANLLEADLAGVNFDGANLDGADLSRANLTGADLTYAVLNRAELTYAVLNRADLTYTKLAGARFTRAFLDGPAPLLDEPYPYQHASLHRGLYSAAQLINADLTGADLRRAHLAVVNLAGADLSHAKLAGADLRQASLVEAKLVYDDLNGVDVSGVILHSTIFGDTNLTAVVGLETCIHIGPSFLDHRTLARSGPLPLAFLRGCGLPEPLIDYLRSLLNEPIQFYSCFISYASKDHAFVERLSADLQNKGVRCYYALENMKIGDRIRPRIDETIRVFDKVLLVLSNASVTSQWVEQEVETALARERQQGTTIIFPVRIDNAVMAIETGWPAFIRNSRHIGDFRRWKTHGMYQKAFDRLLRDLKAAERQPEG